MRARVAGSLLDVRVVVIVEPGMSHETYQPTDRHATEVMQARLQRNIDSHNARCGAGHALSLSIGTIRVDLKSSIDALLSQADTVMYAEKQRKKQSR